MRAWAFYLHGPIEADYRLRGELVARLFLFAGEPLEADIELKVYRVHENRGLKKIASSRFRRVPLMEGLPSKPLEFNVVPRKPVLIKEGDTILVELWFKLGVEQVVFPFSSPSRYSLNPSLTPFSNVIAT